MRTLLLLIIAIAVIATCSKIAHSAEANTSITVDTSPAAVEAAYAAVRAGDATPVASLKETAETMLVKLINAATTTGDFIVDQIPIVIKELLAFNTAKYVVFIVFGVALLVLWGLVLRTIWLLRDEIDRVMCSLLSCFFLGVPALAIFGCNLLNLLKITFAPRVWLIEYAASLVK
jgi:hypothetical protein